MPDSLLTLVKRYLAAEEALLTAERRALPAAPRYRHTRAFIEGMRYALWVSEHTPETVINGGNAAAPQKSKVDRNRAAREQTVGQ